MRRAAKESAKRSFRETKRGSRLDWKETGGKGKAREGRGDEGKGREGEREGRGMGREG